MPGPVEKKIDTLTELMTAVRVDVGSIKTQAETDRKTLAEVKEDVEDLVAMENQRKGASRILVWLMAVAFPGGVAGLVQFFRSLPW